MSERSRAAFPAWRWLLLPGACLTAAADVAFVSLKGQDTAAFLVIVPLAWMGWMVLLDRDACRRAGWGREVFAIHVLALFFGAITGVLASLLRAHAKYDGMHLEAIILLFAVLPIHNLLTALACRSYVTFALSVQILLHGFLMGIVFLHIAYRGYFLDDLFFVLACYAIIAWVGGAFIRWFWIRYLRTVLGPAWAVAWSVISVAGLGLWWLLVRSSGS